MSAHTKPVHQYFNQLKYVRHKNKLADIGNEKILPPCSNSLLQIHKIRNISLSFRHQAHQNEILQENQKLLRKLLDISKRKKSQYSQTINFPQKMVSYNNPARKRRQKMITQMNQQMAERMLTKQSHLDHKSMQRSMEQYQKLKKTISNNKRAISMSCVMPSLQPQKKHKLKQLQKSKTNTINYEQSQGNNPQYTQAESLNT